MSSKRRRLRYDGHCPTCGAVPSHWAKAPKDAVVDIATIERTPADLVDSYNSKDIFRCHHCGFIGQVLEHPETSDGYIDWGDWEYCPSYCPNCGSRVVSENE